MKSRLVVRITNSKVICQIVKAHINGDRVLCYADSTELKKYGIEFGLTNYSAAYATGLLVARRALTGLGLDNIYKAKGEIDGSVEVVEDVENEPRAYQCFLDIGLARSSKGARVFAAMKGVSDGGIRIPHAPSKFYGFNPEDPEKFDEVALRDRIYGKNIAEYMEELKESNKEKYQKQFSTYVKKGVDSSNIESIYETAFQKIKDDPIAVKKEKKDYSGLKKFKVQRLTKEEKQKKIAEKLVN